MKKFIIILLLAGIILSACAQRKLYTPADRLVGHWVSDMNDNLYYSKVDTDSVGSYILYQTNGSKGHHQYKILNQVPEGEKLEIKYFFENGRTREEVFYLSKDGTELIQKYELFGLEIKSELDYVDNLTSPKE